MARKEYYIDPMGDKVPARHVKTYDKKRDRIAMQIAKEWSGMQAKLIDLKIKTVERIMALQEAAAKDAGVPDLGGAKGNIQFRSFDGSVTVALDRQKRTEFDERLAIAEKLILAAVDEMLAQIEGEEKVSPATRDAIRNVARIARAAFAPRRSGNLDMQRIRDLRNLNVKHPKWRKACEIISECERTIGHREYIRVSVRDAADHSPKPITLDIAAL